MAPFSLGSDGDELFLSAADGTVLDYAAYTNMPINGSFGRMDGQRGWFYFAASTPLQPNTGGERRVSSSPVSSLATGQYNGVSSLTVELLAPAGGKVYYTTGDESRFDALTEYSGPITVSLIENNTESFSRTCAIRLKGFTAVLDKFKKNQRKPHIPHCEPGGRLLLRVLRLR